MNSYETWGTINVSLNPQKVDESKQIIEGAIKTIGLAINGMSFLFGASLHWIPARYIRISRISDRSIPVEPVETKDWICLPLPKSQDDHSSVVLKDDHIKNLLFPFIHQVANIPAHIRPTIETALDWHAQANRFASGLNRFVNYWASMELLGNFWNIQLSKKRVPKELKLEIYEKLKLATKDNCLKLVRECKEMEEPPIKAKLNALLDTVVIDTQKRALIKDALFKKDVKSKKSSYDIRNGIAHGNVSEAKLEPVQLITHQLPYAQGISYEIIMSMIEWASQCEPTEATPTSSASSGA